MKALRFSCLALYLSRVRRADFFFLHVVGYGIFRRGWINILLVGFFVFVLKNVFTFLALKKCVDFFVSFTNKS